MMIFQIRYRERWRHLIRLGALLSGGGLGLVASASIDEIESLMSEDVVEANKTAARLFDVPITAHVFDAEDILRLPVDSVPELLRYAPGVHIMRANNGKWGLGIRGMNSAYLGRVAFTVDEQNIYSTLYSGLFGSQHDLLMDDIASVEVVYGPGGGLWSTNAMNGMVNVILKTAFETQGTVIRLQGGSLNQGFSARSGRSWNNERTAGRVFVKLGHRESTETNPLFDDDWDTGRLGFRIDHRPFADGLISLSGELYSSSLDASTRAFDPVLGRSYQDFTAEKQWGVNTQAKLTHQLSSDSGYSLRAFLGYTEFELAFASFDLTVAGLQGSGTWRLGDAHEIIVNTSVTVDWPDISDTATTRFQEDNDTNALSQFGIQDEITLIPGHLSLIGGVTFRHETLNDEFTTLPSLRLLYRPTKMDRMWLSWSRGARAAPVGMGTVENILYNSLEIPTITIPTPFGAFPVSRVNTFAQSEPDLKSETLDAYEIGYRHQSEEGLTLGFNAFYYRYKNLFGATGLESIPVLMAAEPYISNTVGIDNVAEGNAYGCEVYVSYEWSARLTSKFSYAFMDDTFEATEFSPNPILQAITDASVENIDNNAPRHQASLILQGTLTDTIEVDLGLRYSAAFRRQGMDEQESIFQADARIGWSPRAWMHWSLVGRNLLKDETREVFLKDMLGESTAQPREWYLELRLEF